MIRVGDLVRIKGTEKSINMGMFKGRIGIVCEKHENKCVLYVDGIGEISWFDCEELEIIQKINIEKLNEYLEKDMIVLNMEKWKENKFPPS